MLLFVLIPIAWLAISVLVVGICRMAARGDAMPAASASAAAHTERPTTSGARRHLARTRTRLTVHGARVHGAG